MGSKIIQGIIVIFLLLGHQFSFGQHVRVGIGYANIYAMQWDKAIQTYNFSRPHITQKQPLIKNGATVHSSYLFTSNRRYAHGIICSYSYYNSSSANENLSNTLHLHLVKPGYMMHFENSTLSKHLSVDLVVSAVLGGLYRRVDEAPYTYDDKRAKAFGIGGSFDMKCAYQCVKIKKRLGLSPYVSAGFTPYFYAPSFESILNQTKLLVIKSSSGILNFELGVMFCRK